MNVITRILRLLLATDTLLGLLVLPAMVIGCAVAGHGLAALTFGGFGLVVGAIYWRYWRRFPLGRSAL